MIKIKHNIDDLTDEILEELPSKSSSSSAKNSYIQETYFQTKAYEQKSVKPISFSMSNQHYGKLDNNLMSLVPNENKLKTINSENDLQVLDFVADAYFAFLQELQSFKFTNKFSPNSKVYSFEAKGSTESLDQKYDLFLQDQYSYFLDFVNRQNSNDQITDLNSFISTLALFVDSRTPATPYAKSSFLISNRITRKVSGLVIDLDEGDVNDDNNKVENYINDQDFDCFQDLATAFGFVVNKDIPWQIVADLDSVYMKFYFHLRMNQLVEDGEIENNPVPTDKTRFEECKEVLENFDLTNFLVDKKEESKYYSVVNYDDLNNLKNLIYYFYNSYIEYQPTIIKTIITKEINELKLKQTTQYRRLIFSEDLDKEELKSRINRLYVYIKAKEVNASWNQNKFDSIATKTRQLEKTLDSKKAIEYLQREVNSITRSKSKQTNFHF